MWRLVTRSVFAFLLLVVPCSSTAADDDAFTESVVIFNTVCATCHEAECSGRLSFDEALSSSQAHILRYYGPASSKQWLQRELFEILAYMKEKCGYHPMNIPVPPNLVWNEAALDKMSPLINQNYFIPIGQLSPGQYDLEFELEKDAMLGVYLVSEIFETVVDDSFLTHDGRLNVDFSIDDKKNYYIRVYPSIPVKITRIAVTNSESK